MKEQLISLETAILAKEKGFDIPVLFYWVINKAVEVKPELNASFNRFNNDYNGDKFTDEAYSAPTQSLLQKYIREQRGVHIEIHRNASRCYWSMCKIDGGTDLGWSEESGPNPGGVWDTFEDALENALQIQLTNDLPKDTSVIRHWGNYVYYALKK